MKRLVLFLTLVVALATAFPSYGPAAAHCGQTPVGYADLAPATLRLPAAMSQP